MGITEFLGNIRIILGLSNFAIAIATIIIVLIWILIKFVDYVINRVDIKDDKQFEVLYKIIEDKDFLDQLNNQPYLIKQLFYKRFYLLKNYKVEEIEFLMSQSRLEINLNELSNLKSGRILKFKNGAYCKSIDNITFYWANNYRRSNAFIVIGFVFWIVVSAFFCILFLKSITLFYASIVPLLMLEGYLLVKVEVVKSYLKYQDDINDFVYQSEVFKNRQGNSNV